MEFQEVINQRRSIRNYEDRDVEDDKIEYVLECARLAPSWMNMQCWHFIIVTDKDKIKELAKMCGVINRWIKKAPIIVVACADPLSSGRREDINYYLVDTAIAMEHLILAATDVGLGSCWIGSFDEKEIKKLLGIPPRIRIVALTPLGYPSNRGTIGEIGRKFVIRSTKRKKLREFTHWEKW